MSIATLRNLSFGMSCKIRGSRSWLLWYFTHMSHAEIGRSISAYILGQYNNSQALDLVFFIPKCYSCSKACICGCNANGTTIRWSANIMSSATFKTSRLCQEGHTGWGTFFILRGHPERQRFLTFCNVSSAVVDRFNLAKLVVVTGKLET